MAEDLYALVYVSKSLCQFDDCSLSSLTKSAAVYNNANNVTGFISFKDGFFVQYLEGAKPDVSYLMHKIRDDKRHLVLDEVVIGHLDKRNFLGWDMQLLNHSHLANLAFEDVLQWASMSLNLSSKEHVETLERINNLSYVMKNIQYENVTGLPSNPKTIY